MANICIIIIKQIGSYIEKCNTTYGAAIPIQKKGACAHCALQFPSEYRTIGHLFGTDKTTAGEILHVFCFVLADKVFTRLIKFSITDAEIQEVIDGLLFTNYGYPLCVGILDGTHIVIKLPFGYEVDYFNYNSCSWTL